MNGRPESDRATDRRRAFVVVLALAASCAPAGPAIEESTFVPPPFSPVLRVVWRRSAPESDAAVTERALVRVAIPEELGAWTIQAPHSGAAEADGAPLLEVGAAQSDEVIRLSRPAQLDMRDFDHVQFDVTFEGRGSLVLDFRSEQELVASTAPVPLARFTRPQTVVFPVPPELRLRPRVDAIALRCTGGRRLLGLASLALAADPDALVVDEGLVVLGTDGRRGLGLTHERSLGAEVAVPDGEAVLGFDYGRPADLVRHHAPELVLTVTGADGTSEELRFAIVDEAVPVWRAARIPLAAWRGRTVELALSLVSEGPAAAVVADAAVWVPSADPPTVTLVTTDTHRGDHLGAAPDGVAVDTPVLDDLAARGALFSDCYAPTNVTNPSHAALMTGVHVRDVGVFDNLRPLDAEAWTLADAFARAGWSTQAVIAARHLGDEGSGLGQGFDRFSRPEEAQRRADAVVDVVRAWAPDVDDRPLFLWVHVFDAHTPYDPPASHDRRYYPADRDPFDPALPEPPWPVADHVLPEGAPPLRDPEFARAQYRAEIAALDGALGGLLDAGRSARGVVAFVGDHGEALARHRPSFGHHALYPETLHVPLILAWPGGPAGRVVSAPLTHLDVGRTLLDLAGLADTVFPGRSLRPLAEGRRREPEPRFGISAHGRSAALQFKESYLILHLQAHASHALASDFDRHQVELYDLASDPGCTRELSAERPRAAATLRRRLVAWLEDQRTMDWTAAAVDDAGAVERLQQLGYVGGASPAGALWEADDCARCRTIEAGGR